MSHINKLESLQSKILRTIVDAPWHVRNEDIRNDLNKKIYIRLSEKFFSFHKVMIDEQQFLIYIILFNPLSAEYSRPMSSVRTARV